VEALVFVHAVGSKLWLTAELLLGATLLGFLVPIGLGAHYHWNQEASFITGVVGLIAAPAITIQLAQRRQRKLEDFRVAVTARPRCGI
jgi:Kef-type K+ transport system membrane component KefB